MAAVTIYSDFGALQKSLSLFPLFLHLFAMRWWDWMPWSWFSECWVLSWLLKEASSILQLLSCSLFSSPACGASSACWQLPWELPVVATSSFLSCEPVIFACVPGDIVLHVGYTLDALSHYLLASVSSEESSRLELLSPEFSSSWWLPGSDLHLWFSHQGMSSLGPRSVCPVGCHSFRVFSWVERLSAILAPFTFLC